MMRLQEFTDFYHKPCKFRFKSGKEVYGVIWRDPHSDDKGHYFASSGAYRSLFQARKKGIREGIEDMRTPVDINEIVGVEHLDNVA